MTNKSRLSYIIAQHALDSKRSKTSITELSRATSCTISSLWFYFNQKRRWPADSWLKTLWELGAIDVKKNSITIQFPGDTFKDHITRA